MAKGTMTIKNEASGCLKVVPGVEWETFSSFTRIDAMEALGEEKNPYRQRKKMERFAVTWHRLSDGSFWSKSL